MTQGPRPTVLSAYGSRGDQGELAASAKAEAYLPQGCLPRIADAGWDGLVDMSHPELFNTKTLISSFTSRMERVESSLVDIADLTSKRRAAFCARAIDV